MSPQLGAWAGGGKPPPARGPHAPTLGGYWHTSALAAHLVGRERRPDSLPGIGIPRLAGHTESVRRGYQNKPYAELVRLVRTGPGRLSPFSLPGADGLLNATEYAVHHEDVRRAQPDWTPRRLPSAVQDALWKVVGTRASMSFRSLGAATGVVLRRSDAPDTDIPDTDAPDSDRQDAVIVASKGGDAVTLTGEPMELLLYLFGRRDHARVEISGSASARAALAEASLAV